MVSTETKGEVLVAIVLTEKGVSSLRVGADDDGSTERAYTLLAKLTPQIRALDAAARLAAL